MKEINQKQLQYVLSRRPDVPTKGRRLLPSSGDTHDKTLNTVKLHLARPFNTLYRPWQIHAHAYLKIQVHEDQPFA
jgi:hypothetical protein